MQASGSISRQGSILKVEDKAYDMEAMRQLFNGLNNDRTSRFLANKVFQVAKELGLSIHFSDTLGGTRVGAYSGKDITLSRHYFEHSLNSGKKAEIILHELIHAVTSYALGTDDNALSKPLLEFKRNLNQLFLELRHNPALREEYGVTNVKDFIAELANPIFRQKIQSIDNGRRKSFWQRIVDAFKRLFGIQSSSPYYTRMINTLDKDLSNIEREIYFLSQICYLCTATSPSPTIASRHDWALSHMLDIR